MLEYASTNKVSVSAARKIQEEIGAIDRAWWRGAIGLEPDETDRPSVLSGSTALFHRGQEIPDGDDLFMAFADGAFIVDLLWDWSKRFKVKWHLRMNGDDWGAIDQTGLTPPLLGQMEKWARRAGVSSGGKGRWSIPEDRRTALFRRHPGRR